MLTKQQFLDLLKAYKEDKANHDLLKEQIKTQCVDSYIIVKDNASQDAIIKLLKDTYDDNRQDSDIDYYMFTYRGENEKATISEPDADLVYTIDNDEDLYYWLTAGKHMEDDGLYYISEYIDSITISDGRIDKLEIPKNHKDRYFFIYQNLDKVIEYWNGFARRNGELDYHVKNIQILLYYLKQEIEKDA